MGVRSGDVEAGRVSWADELRQRGLGTAKAKTESSIPLHPTVRTTILVILGQLARGAGERRGLVVHPATNWPTAATDLIEALSRESMPSCEGVVKLDLEPVTLDLSSIPLEEVLQLREEHREAHKAYMRSLRGFLVELGRINDPAEREVELLQRREEIAEMAHGNRRSVGALGLGPNLVPGAKETVGAYSYLFAVTSAFGGSTEW